MKGVTAFLPCRKGSERVPRKNTRTFAGIEGGLARIKLGQLLACPEITALVVSSDDEEVLELARSTGDGRVTCVPRPPELATSAASTDDLIRHAGEILPPGPVLWTHTTSPFVDAAVYGAALRAWREALDAGYDSLLGVTRIHKFIWNADGPVNYDRTREKWPRTQTLAPLWEVNSAVFLADRSVYLERGDRIGARPFFFELDMELAFDIDWEPDFLFAERRWLDAHPA